MNGPKLILALCCITTLSLQASTTNGEPGNPFRVIVASNVFRLRPPAAEPETKPSNPEPLPPLSQVMLTGIHTVFGPPQALFEVTETVSGKPVTHKPILREGERAGQIHVLAIDVEKSLVLIRNGIAETNLTFDPLRQTTTPAVASVPMPALNKLLPPTPPPAHGG